MRHASLILVTLALAGCPKDDPAKTDASAPPPAASSATPRATASASASAANAGAVAASFEGKYTATPAELYIPSENKDYSGVKQAKDDGTKMVGEGTLTLAVDGAGRVTGTIDSGPAQGSIVDGVVEGGALSGTVRVKTAGEDGLHGSLLGKMSADGIDGSMKLADSNASVLREAKFSLKKK